MPKASPIQTSFNAGELAPSMAGRVDVAKYLNGCHKLENFLGQVQGPGERRPGTHFVSEVKDSGWRTWIIPFRYNREQSYVVELGDVYARFYTDRGVLLSGGVPYEIGSPFGAGGLTDAGGRFVPTIAQSNDAMFFATRAVFPQMLERRAHTNWAFRQYGLPAVGTFKASQYAFQWPFKSFNIDTAKAIYADATTGAVNLVALAATFEPWMVGQLILLETSIGTTVAAWEVGKAIIVGDQRRVENRVYVCTVAGTTGTIRPTHTEGSKPDGDVAVTWQFLHPGYGVVQINAVADPLNASGVVVTELPSDVLTAPHATYRWQVSAWQSEDGFPDVVAFFRERLWFFRGISFWASAAGDYFNFAERDNGEVLPDSAISGTISSDTADSAKWARATDSGLLVGTDGGEYLISEISGSEPIGPANVQAKRQSSNGCAPIQAVGVQETTLYVQAGGRVLREGVFAIEDNQIKSRDVTVLSEHITETGIVAMAFQPIPRSTLWCVRFDGLLISFTYNREQDVYGWHRHLVGGGGVVESVASIPSPDGTVDDLWLIVRRTIAGSTKRYVEYMDRGFRDGEAIADAWFVDCGLGGGPVVLVAGVATIGGLGHLEGKTVDVLLDGSTYPQQVVVGGAITVTRAATKVIVGLPCPCTLSTMRTEAGSADGTSQGKTKRIHRVTFRFINTVGGRAGPSEDPLEAEEIEFRDYTMAMDQPIPPFTGDKTIDWPGTYETDARIFYVNDQPLPVTIAAIMPQLVTQDR